MKQCDRDEPPWIPLWGFVDPPEPPDGFRVEVEYDSYMGFAISYRYIPIN